VDLVVIGDGVARARLEAQAAGRTTPRTSAGNARGIVGWA
jgi:hypothetical protein